MYIMKTRAIFRSLFAILFLLLIVATVILMLVVPGREDARKREELGDPLAFVTSTARTPWAYVDEEGTLVVYPEDCAGLEVLRLPESVNGVTVTHVGNAFSTDLTFVKRVIFPSTVASPKVEYTLMGWTSLEELVLREGCTDLKQANVRASQSMESVYLPRSLEKIGWCFLSEGDGSPTVYYAGTEEEWQALGADARRISERYTVVCQTEPPTAWLENTK